jgi:hypothetical protein
MTVSHTRFAITDGQCAQQRFMLPLNLNNIYIYRTIPEDTSVTIEVVLQ